MRRIVAATSIVLVGGLLALWWSRTGGAHARTQPRSSGEQATVPAPPHERAAEPRACTLLITVRDATNGAPLPGSTVLARPSTGAWFETTTEADGHADLEPFDGSIVVERRGYARQSDPVWFTTPRLIFVLSPAIPVRGRVVMAGSGTGIEGASVGVVDIDALETIADLVTDREGRFEIPGVPPDTPFLVEAQRPGMAPVGRVERRPDPDREIVLELGGGAAIEGRVLRSDGTPVAGASVTVSPRGGEPFMPELSFSESYEARSTADAEGRFRIQGLRVPATYEIVAEDDVLGTGTTDDVPFFAVDDSAWREIRFAARTAVHVRVEFPPGTPWPHPGVALRRDGKSVGVARGAIDEGGFTWETDALGAHEVWVGCSNWPGVRVPIDVHDGLNEVVVHMTREGHRAVSGRVVSENGAPVGGAKAEVAFTVQGRVLRTYPAEDGGFSVCDVPDAIGTLEVRNPEGTYLPWKREGVAPDTQVEVVLRVAARITGRIDPIPARRRIVVHCLYRHHRFTDSYAVADWYLSVDENGRFEVPWSPDRGILLAFDPPDAAPILIDVPPLTKGETRDLGVLHPEPGRTVEGLVVDDAGAPVADCRMNLEIRSPPGVSLGERLTRSGPDGRFRFDRLPDAPIRVETSADGLVPRTIELSASSDLQGMEIRLVRAGTVEGTLLGPERRPISGGAIEVAPTEGEESTWATADSLGRFRVQLAPGKYRLRNDEHDGPVVEVRARETTRVEFRLR